MAALLDDLQRWGQPRMTGTGSAVFLPMTSAEAAIATARQLKSRYNVRAVSGLDRSPLLDRLDAEGP
jgi:4-diphosphocytidyl-2C-methyl-D-erythritol kinase